MFTHILLRLSLMAVFALLGWKLGLLLGTRIPPTIPLAKRHYCFMATFLGAVVGFATAPRLVITPGRTLQRQLKQTPLPSLFVSVIGLIMGLLVAALLTIPLSLLPGQWGHFSPLVGAVVFGFLGMALLRMHEAEMLPLVRPFSNRDQVGEKKDRVLLDTSVIIDGRIADIRKTGFVSGTLVVPRFVLNELHHIADSSDDLRRRRGRRGLEMLNNMQRDESVPLEISERNVRNGYTVDAKLVKLAQELDCPILTNDYNLNRVAELQGVRVLNINELANTVKTVVLPGETLRVHIIQEGKEPRQGVGYLDDGTMIVIENGERYIDKEVDIEVTRVLQTAAGRMIFGNIKGQ
ncbi:MAG: PIN domain-containing protein [Chloroflexota bacterium]|nr:PIN domain-containing protein [Chloroflexota bacterium]